jgi:predicted RNA-binding Zn-ribbon protein involved in translation (DUF1610 family)
MTGRAGSSGAGNRSTTGPTRPPRKRDAASGQSLPQCPDRAVDIYECTGNFSQIGKCLPPAVRSTDDPPRRTSVFRAAAKLLAARRVQASPCPRCGSTALVRAEALLSEQKITRTYYCESCKHEWQFSPERRQGERPVGLRAKPDRRRT